MMPTPAAAPRAPLLSVVSPVYRAAGIVDELVRRLLAALAAITPDFEVVLVDDGSPDDSWRRIAAAGAADARVKGVRLSRNFGQHQAITAGLDRAAGRFVAVMDCDLQDDPADIARLYAKALEGHDVVLAVRRSRSHGGVKNLQARLFFAVLNGLRPGRRASPQVGAFSILSRRAVRAFRRVGDVHRHYLGVVHWLGFPAAEVAVEHHPRLAGRSTYGFGRLMRHAVDGIVSQSDRPLYWSLAAGALFVAAALATAATALATAPGAGRGPIALAALVLFAGGVNLLALGTVGIYVGKTFDQARRRPLYLVREVVNLDDEEGTGG